jgi:hypothetical protein
LFRLFSISLSLFPFYFHLPFFDFLYSLRSCLYLIFPYYYVS